MSLRKHGTRPSRSFQRKALVTTAASGLEGQAEQRGRLFAHGETGLAQGLSSVPAAAFVERGSKGEPLPHRLREELEGAFGADLCAVRIHRDAPAALAAARFGAAAFTSGADIYFGSGRFKPHSEPGRTLIGHEIAHVLQQTGRASAVPAGFEARPLHGNARVQCDSADPGSAIADQKAGFEYLADAHRGGSNPSGDVEFENIVDTARTLLSGRIVVDGSKPAFSTGLKAKAERGDFDKLKSSRARSFVFDCLKFLGWYAEAASLLSRDSDFKMTTFTDVGAFWSFLQSDQAYGRDWLASWLTHREFKQVWPAAILRGWRAFYFRPTRIPPYDTALSKRMHDNASQIQATERKSPTTLKTEAYWGVWKLIDDLETDRIREQTKLRTKLIQLTGQQSIFEVVAEELPRWRNEAQQAADAENGVPHEKLLAAEKIKLIDEAAAYWKKALADFSAWRNAWQFDDATLLDSTAPVPAAKYAASEAAPLRSAFVAAATALFETRKDSDGNALLPAADEYRQQIVAFGRILGTTVVGKKGAQPVVWLDKLEEIAFAEATAAKPDPARLSEIAILPLIVDQILGIARSYDAAADQAAPHFDDIRRAHRARLARAILRFGRWLGWNELIETVSDVLSNVEGVKAGGGARLMLVSDWEADKVRPIADLLVDFAAKADEPIIEETPFTLRVIVEWFRYDYHRRLREVLDTLLLAEDRLSRETRLDFTPLDHLKQTRAEVRSAMAPTAEAEFAIEKTTQFPIQVPQRFFVKDFDLLAPPGASVDFLELISAHKKTEQQLGRRAAYIILPEDPKQGVFAWLLPPLDGLYKLMLAIPAIADLAARRAGETDASWYQRLAKERGTPAAPGQTAELSPDDWKRLNAALLKWITTFGKREEEAIPGLWRRVIILRRRWLTLQLAPLIENFAENPYVSHGPSGESQKAQALRLATPDLIIQLMRSFETGARPMREQAAGGEADAKAEGDAVQLSVDVQMALLAFGLAPALLKLRPETIDWGLKRVLYEYFQLAIDFAEDAKKLELLKAGLGPSDEAAYVVIPADRRAAIVQKMKDFMSAVETELKTWQTERGFRSEDGKTINSNAHHVISKIEPSKTAGVNEWRIGQTVGEDGKLDENTGIPYRLVEVYTKFEYHPAIGQRPRADMRKGAGGPFSPARIVIDGVEHVEPDLPDTILLRYSVNNREHEVRANDLATLDELDDLFLWRAFQLDLAASVLVIETFADWMMTVASMFFPEAAIAEFVAGIAQMLAEGDLEDLVRQVKHDPIGFAEQLVKQFTGKIFDPSQIWEFVFLGAQHSPLQALEGLWPKRQAKAKPQGKLARIVSVLRSLGARFMRAVDRVHERTQPAFRRAEGKIAMRPTLAWVLRRASHLITALRDLIPADKIEEARSKDGPDYLKEFRDLLSAEDIGARLREHVIEMLEGIRRIELPKEIIDLTPAIELIIGSILTRFGSRGKILKLLLSTMPVPDDWKKSKQSKPGYTTALHFISGVIKDEFITGSVIDPNKYWAKDILPLLGKKFDAIRDDLVEGLYGLVDSVLEALDLPPLKRPSASELPQAETVGEPLDPEGEASMAAPSAPRFGPPVLRATGGVRLGAGPRRTFERAFGADFSHVRVHEGAAAATRPIGANAITSGSHIFLRPGIGIGSAPGKRLLAHELTHVVQQTGARGKGIGPRPPGLGRTGVGLRISPERERVADRVAARMGTGRPLSRSLRSQIGISEGIQPSIETGVATRILAAMSSAEARDFTKDLKGGKDPEGFSDAKALSSQIFEVIQLRQPGLKFAKFMSGTAKGKDIHDVIREHLLNRRKEIRQFDLELKRVAQLAQRPRSKKQEDEPDTELNPAAFVQLLANYLFAETGVAIAVDTDSKVTKVQHVELFGLNMAEIGGTSALWDAVMHNSFGSTTVTDLAKAQREMRERLRGLGPQPSVWDASSFKFAKHIVNEYLEQLRLREGKLDEVPRVKDYVDTASKEGSGLALATHGELTRRGIGDFKRESHHTSQYLLVEFFGNDPDASVHAFPGASYDQLVKDFGPAGIKFKQDSTVEAIEGTGDAIRVSDLNPDSNRGSKMPAILISAQCHQRGELHMLREARWNASASENKGTRTQGFAIENKFNESIKDERLRPRHTDPQGRERTRQAISADPAGAKRAYYLAAQATYNWMRERMIPALSEGLNREEYAYYRGIAARNHETDGKMEAPWDLTHAHLDAVFEKARTQNDDVMRRYNWKAV